MNERIRVSTLTGAAVADAAGAAQGRAQDAVVRLLDGGRPRVIGLVVRTDAGDVFVHAADLAAIEDGTIRLGRTDLDTRPFERRRGEVLLVRDVVNRGVIDVEGARLIHVQDLVLEGEGGSWAVTAAVPAPPGSFSGLLRRLVGRPVSATEEVPWSHIEPLTGHMPTVARRLPLFRLAQLRPADIADIVEQASHAEREEILEAVHQDSELEADVFEELDEEDSAEFLKDRSDAATAELLATMEPDAAADLLMEMDQARRRPILDLLPPDQKNQVLALLGHHPDTAGGLMSTEFVALAGDIAVGSALERLRALEEVPSVLTDVFVVADDLLVGSVTLAALVRAEPALPLSEVMQDDPVAVYPDADLPSVAVQMSDYNLSSLPVVDGSGRLVGVITHDDLLEAMVPQDWRWRGRAEQARLAEPGH
ncbi:MAG: magnesium transporter MgtE N-terminal domain-containing protein [Candidatus Dormibacteria bacterium]